MDITTIQNFLCAILPAIASIIGNISVAVVLLKNFAGLINAIRGATNIKDLKTQVAETESTCQVLLKENAELKKTLNKLLTKFDNIYREDDEATTVDETPIAEVN